MKRIIVLFLILASTTSAIAQSPLAAGDNCFEAGDYVCAQVKYQEAMNTAIGRDKQIAEIRYTRAKSCGDWLAEADSAFNGGNYQLAKENYQSVLNENLNDSYAQTQLEKSEKAIKDSIWLKASKETITLSSTEGSESIGVNTNATSYNITQYPKWCTVKAYSSYFDIIYETNPSTIARTGLVKITAGNKEVEIHLTQLKKQEITLSVSRENLNLNEVKKSIMIDVNTNSSDYQITNLPSWCRVKNKYSNWFSLEVDANYSSSSREGWFNVNAGDKNVKISLHQLGVKSKREIITKNRSRSSDYSFFAIGFEGGQIANYGIRMEFGGRSFIGMFLNVRSSFISDEEILQNYGFLENKNEGVIGLNFRMARWAYLNLGAGYGYSQVLKTSETLMQVEYIPLYGGLTFRLGRRINLSAGVSYRDIDIDVGDIDPEFTLGLTINLKR